MRGPTEQTPLNKQTPEPRNPGITSVTKRLATRPARIPSKVVLGGDTEVILVHGNEEYFLRVADDGKLVLSR
jgi:hemin uptake protein HemP